MYTANTMAAAIEALGMSLPYSSSIPAEDPRQARRVPRGRRGDPATCSRRDLKPRDIMTRAAFENAMVVVMAARRLDQRRAAPDRDGPRGRRAAHDRRLPDGQRPRPATSPTSSPAASTCMEDLHDVGGTPAVMKYAARSRAARRRLHDRHRQDASPRTSAELPGLDAGPEDRPPARQADQGDAATSASCAATSAPTARSPRSPARKACEFSGPANVLRQRRRHARTAWSRRRSTRAT